MKLIKNVRALALLCVVGVGLWGVPHLYRLLTRIDSVELIYDEAFSSFCQEMISDSLDYLKGVSTHQLSRCCNAVRAAHPEIAAIRASLGQRGKLVCEIDAHAVVCKINEEHLLLENNTIVSSLLYESVIQEKLIPVSTLLPDLSSTDCRMVRAALAQLDEKIINTYRICYQDVHHVSLIHKADQLSIACAPDMMPSTQKIEQCEIVAHHCKKTSSHQLMVADVRFEKQIVVYVNARGDKNGTHIT